MNIVFAWIKHLKICIFIIIISAKSLIEYEYRLCLD